MDRSDRGPPLVDGPPLHPADHGPFALRHRPLGLPPVHRGVLRLTAVPCLGIGQAEPKSYSRQLLGIARGLNEHVIDSSVPWSPFRHVNHDPKPPSRPGNDARTQQTPTRGSARSDPLDRPLSVARSRVDPNPGADS